MHKFKVQNLLLVFFAALRSSLASFRTLSVLLRSLSFSLFLCDVVVALFTNTVHTLLYTSPVKK